MFLNSFDISGTVLAAGNNLQFILIKGGGKEMPKR